MTILPPAADGPGPRTPGPGDSSRGDAPGPAGTADPGTAGVADAAGPAADAQAGPAGASVSGIVAGVGRIRAVLDDLGGAAAWALSEAELAATTVELVTAQAQLAELELRVLAAADAADVAKLSAAASTGAWLAHATRHTRGAAHAQVRLAGRLDTTYPATRTALAAGTILLEQAAVIVAAIDALPASVSAAERARAEAHLIGCAGEFDARDLKILGTRLWEVIDPENAERIEGERLAKQEREAARKTFLSLHDNGDGTVSGRLKLPVLHAHMLTTALDALLSPRRGKHPLTSTDGTRIPRPDRLGHALCEYLERYPTRRLPQAGGVSASVMVTMTLAQLTADLDQIGLLGVATTDTGLRISAALARRLACEAGIIPAVLGTRSELLDVGRTSRLHTKVQRIVIGQRDKTCRTRGCHIPANRCEVHHPIPWSHGGPTSVVNGALLCPWHHHHAHDPTYTTTRHLDGTYTFHRRT